MKEMISKVTTVPYNSAKSVGAVVKSAQRDQVRQAAPTIDIQGVPGEYDFRKFLTPAFEGWRPVQSGVGGIMVGSIVITTNNDSWKSPNNPNVPVYINGLFGPVKNQEDTSSWYTDLSSAEEGGPPVDITTTDDHTLPTKAIVTGQTTAKPFSVRLTQAAQKR
jgi:hypothetical protein